MWISSIVILLLIVANGIFALSEMAVVNARKARLQQMVEQGKKGAGLALALLETPTRFLATVQVGITLIGVLSGAFGSATIAEPLAELLNRIPALVPYSQQLSLMLVVLCITYLSLVIGELAPKRIALNNAERFASFFAPVMHFLSIIATPIVSFLSISTEVVLRLLRANPPEGPSITEEEINLMMATGTEEGTFEPQEQVMVKRVFQLADRSVQALITPRTEVVFLDLEDSMQENLDKIIDSGLSRFPVIEGTPDNVIGLVDVKHVFSRQSAGQPIDFKIIMQPPLFVVEAAPALKLLELFKQSRAEFAVVLDEFGGVLGVVTLTDILEAIVGEVITMEQDEPEVVRRDDGSWLMDGKVLIDDLRDIIKVEKFPGEDSINYDTLGGLIMSELGEVPETGSSFEWGGYHFEVVDMDINRIDKVLVWRITSDEDDTIDDEDLITE